MKNDLMNSRKNIKNVTIKLLIKIKHNYLHRWQ